MLGEEELETFIILIFSLEKRNTERRYKKAGSKVLFKININLRIC